MLKIKMDHNKQFQKQTTICLCLISGNRRRVCRSFMEKWQKCYLLHQNFPTCFHFDGSQFRSYANLGWCNFYRRWGTPGWLLTRNKRFINFLMSAFWITYIYNNYQIYALGCPKRLIRIWTNLLNFIYWKKNLGVTMNWFGHFV